MSTVYLTNGEKKAFLALPEGIRKGFEVEAEKLKYEDTLMRKQIRFGIMNFSNPNLQAMKAKLLEDKDENAFKAIVKDIDVMHLPEGDLAQIIFAFGPDQMGVFISDLIQKAKTRGDIDMIAGFAGLRHTMLESLSSQFSTVS